ncbi:MAG: vWA domain-containing protein [Nitrososphaerales archaeon]
MSSNKGFLRESKGSDTIYIIDRSKSMGDNFGETDKSKFEFAKASLIKTLSSGCFLASDRLGVIFVNETILSKPIITETLALTEILPLFKSKALPIEKIMSMESEGGTAVQTGIAEALRIARESKTTNDLNLVVLTDSRYDAKIKFDLTIAEAREKRAKIYFVVLGERKEKRNLQIVSELTGGRLFYVSEPYELERLMESFHQAAPEESSHQAKVHSPEPISEKMRATEEGIPTRTLDEIQDELRHLTDECSIFQGRLTRDERLRGIFREKHPSIMYHLYELRQLIEEHRSSLGRVSNQSSETQKDKTRRVSELERRITLLFIITSQLQREARE